MALSGASVLFIHYKYYENKILLVYDTRSIKKIKFLTHI